MLDSNTDFSKNLRSAASASQRQIRFSHSKTRAHWRRCQVSLFYWAYLPYFSSFERYTLDLKLVHGFHLVHLANHWLETFLICRKRMLVMDSFSWVKWVNKFEDCTLRPHESSQKFGSIFSMSLLGQDIVIINDHKTAEKILEENGSSSAGRYHSFVTMDLYAAFLHLSFSSAYKSIIEQAGVGS